MLIVLALACALSIPVLNRLAEGTVTPTNTVTPEIIQRLDAPLYEENFALPGQEWEISTREEAEYRLDGGAYSIEVYQENWTAWNTVGQEFTDFEIVFEVALVSGDTYNDAGILFRFQDADNYYEVDINGEGSFAVGKEVDDEWIQIVEWTTHPTIQPFGRVNRVRLVAEGNQFTLYINDEWMDSFQDNSFASGGIGPVVTAYDTPPARATFDNLKIWGGTE
jgi:hypothetical protein